MKSFKLQFYNVYLSRPSHQLYLYTLPATPTTKHFHLEVAWGTFGVLTPTARLLGQNFPTEHPAVCMLFVVATQSPVGDWLWVCRVFLAQMEGPSFFKVLDIKQWSSLNFQASRLIENRRHFKFPNQFFNFLAIFNAVRYLNPIPTRGGAHCAPPPRYTSSNISGTPWATDLKLSDNLNELNWKIKIYFSTASAHPWLP